MFRKTHLGRPTALLALFLLGGMCPAFGAGFKQLHGHVPEVTRHLTATGPLPGTNELHLAIGVPLRDPAGLEKFLADVYDPASPNYRHFLTPEESTARFSATEADYAAVKNFALTNGFKISGEHGNRLLLDVTAKAADVERAFHFHLKKFQHPTEAREFFAPDAEPTVDANLPVADIQGLSDYSRPHPKSHRTVIPAGATPKNGSAPNGYSYIGNDFRNAYVPSTMLTGAGQSVGLFQFDGFYSNDIATYAQTAGGGRTNIIIQTVLTDSYNGVPTTGANSGNGEVSLDIEMAMAMAPGLAKIVVFEADPNTGNANTILAAMVTNTAIKQFSCSWGWQGPNTTTENYFNTMATQGQSFFNASGDGDAFVNGSNNDVNSSSQSTYPSGSPNITQVGGTALTMNGSGTSYASEIVWNQRTVNKNGGYWGSSGGISTNTIPYWQTNIVSITNGTSKGSSTNRNIPDVAMTATNCYVKYGNGSSGSFGGTSCAAPLWAGFTALVNQQAALAGRAPGGFLNPAIYTIGKSANYTNCFHDITVGDNYWPSSTANFPAVTGYDLCTGWGTPNGANLINALAGVPVISPVSGFVAAGAVGGPFSPTSVIFSLTNSSTSNLVWSLVNTSVWLNVSTTNGTLVPNTGSNVTVSLSAAANNLSAGSYAGNILFTNRSAAVALNLSFQLQLGQSLVQNGGFETGSYVGWTLVDNGSYDVVDNGSSYGITPHTGTYAFDFGQPNALAYLSQTLATVPGQAYLLSFWYENASPSGTTEKFIVNWITNTTGTNVLMNLLNPATFSWTVSNYVVNATSTNTTLQFAVENDPSYFGLDDVSVTPIPMPTVTGFSKKTNTLTLTWNSLAGISYQVLYKTNLFQSAWLTNFTTNATGNIINFTNTIGSDRQRFYRIQRSP